MSHHPPHRRLGIAGPATSCTIHTQTQPFPSSFDTCWCLPPQAMQRFADMDGPGCRQSAAEIVQLVAACAEARQQPPGWRNRLLRLPRRELRSSSHGSVCIFEAGL
jgi:hypothetical protein